jgi:hypothetical protein
MNKQETKAEFKRQIRLLMASSTPKERLQIRMLLIKLKLARMWKNAIKRITAVLKGVIGKSSVEKAKHE